MKAIFSLILTVLASLPLVSCAANLSNPVLDQKAVLVTGASSGIGKQIALTLAENGFFVYAGARKAKDIEALSAIPNIQGIRLDVTVQTEIDAAVATIREQGRGLYGLVNNAGVFLFDPLIEVSERDMQFIMDVNLFGPYRVTKAFAPLIMESKGRITTTGSIAGIFSVRLMGPYGMSKHAVEGFTEALAAEMAKFDVQVSVVEPGNFRSNIMSNMQRRIAQLNSGERSSQFEEEIARFANFVKTDRSQHMAPAPVAEAVLDFMIAEQPKLRYLVAPNQAEAHYTIRRALQRAVELNQGQSFAQTREQLIATLDELLARADSSMLAQVIRTLTLVKPNEQRAALASFAIVFLLMASYFVLRPVRDAMASDWSDAEVSLLWNIQFFLSIGLVSLYSLAISRLPFRWVVPSVYGAFALSFLLFFLITPQLSDPTLVEKGFYLWVAAFSLFNLSVFWSFMADTFRREQGQRLFAIIGAGASAGAIIGPGVPALFADSLGLAKLMFERIDWLAAGGPADPLCSAVEVYRVGQHPSAP